MDRKIIALLIATLFFVSMMPITGVAQLGDIQVDVNPVDSKQIDVTVQSNMERGDTATADISSLSLTPLSMEEHNQVYIESVTLTAGGDASPSFTFRHTDGDSPAAPKFDGMKTLSRIDTTDIGQTGSQGLSEIEYVFSVDTRLLENNNADQTDVVIYQEEGGRWIQSNQAFNGEQVGRAVFSVVDTELRNYSITIRQSSMQISDISLSSENVGVGEELTIEVSVTNNGSSSGVFSGQVRSDGNLIATGQESISAGQSKTLTFTHTFEEIGVYPITVNEMDAGEVRVTESGGNGGQSDTDNESDDGEGQPGLGITAAILGLLFSLVIVKLRN